MFRFIREGLLGGENMKVLYKNPENDNYKKWFDNNGTFDIWYEEATTLFDYSKKGYSS